MRTITAKKQLQQTAQLLNDMLEQFDSGRMEAFAASYDKAEELLPVAYSEAMRSAMAVRRGNQVRYLG